MRWVAGVLILFLILLSFLRGFAFPFMIGLVLAFALGCLIVNDDEDDGPPPENPERHQEKESKLFGRYNDWPDIWRS